ncbi:hypothetical protein PS687_05359 [Pseudomonas fluorescens]|nr:hypothetical protein PS687_05359 [Pseudomonas fluorescens]
MRLADQRIEARQQLRFHAQGFQLQTPGLLVEQAHHHALAVPGGHRRHANINRPAGYTQGNASVLGQAFFGDIELGHDLDPRHQRSVQRFARRHHIAQRAVDAVAHHGMGFVGFYVDITRLIAGGLGEQGVDHADHRGAVLGVEQIGDFGHVLHQAVEVHLILRSTDHSSGAAGIGIGTGEQAVEFVVAYLLNRRLTELALDFTDGPAGS